jgi:hypothetical protein
MPLGFDTTGKTYWNGQLSACRRLRAIVGQSPSGWWCAKLAGQERDVVEVTYYDAVFYIDNQNGSGWEKVTEGRGQPIHPHRALPISRITKILEETK